MLNRELPNDVPCELYDLLMNHYPFYQSWFQYAQKQIVPALTDGEHIEHWEGKRLFWDDSWGYSTDVLFAIRKLVEPHLVAAGGTFAHPVDVLEQLYVMLLESMNTEIKLGSILLPSQIEHQLTVLYANGEAVNVAKACREGQFTRTVAKKLMDTYSHQVWSRYVRLRNGERYHRIMGHSEGFAHTYPKFKPLVRVNEDSQIVLKAGDMVASVGSSRWFTVNSLGISGQCVFTSGGVMTLPVTMLDAQYRSVAHRFIRILDNQPC